MAHPLLRSLSFAAAALVAVPPAVAVPQTRGQRRCVSTLQRAGLGVGAAQARRNLACLRAVAGGDDADLTACVETDGDGRVTAATRKTRDDAIARCAADPADLGVPPALELTVNEATLVHGQGLVRDLFGDDLAAICSRATDRAGARCQLATLAGAQRLARSAETAALACMNAALRRGSDDPTDLATCLDNSARVDRAAAKLAKTIGRRCTDPALLPGICGGATLADLGTCVAERARCRACRRTATATGVPADCDLVDDGSANASCEFLVSAEGNALDFLGGTAAPIADGDVTILEFPGRVATTGSRGQFRFDGLPEGSDVTFVLAHPSYHPIQTGTIHLGARGVERVTFQAVTFTVFDAFAALLSVVPDPARCQMVTTVTRVGKSIYDPGAHGEDRVIVTLHPPLPPEQGPIYFNSSVLPDRSLARTSDDGGVLFIQVPAGDYVWTAFKPARTFTRVRMACRAGFLVNASPPWGLQAH